MRVALASCLELPEPDPEQIVLQEALISAGLETAFLPWDDPQVDWSGFDVCVLRSTWNYHLHPQAFLAWLDTTDRVVTVWNRPQLVRWNAHKSYLLDLERRGFPIVPTALLKAGAGTPFGDVLSAWGWEEVVVKPAVSAGSRDTLRVTPASVAEGEQHLATLLAREDVLVQRYLPDVDLAGERSQVWIDGARTHAVQKRARFEGEDERVVGPVPLPDDEAELAARLLAEVAPEALYARVDVARDPEGRPRLMELELIEPSLFTHLHRPALDRLVGAISSLGKRRA